MSVCPSCGESVIYSYGCWDAALYQDGSLHRHLCEIPRVPNRDRVDEKWWAGFVAQPDARILLGLAPLPSKPVTPPRRPARPPRVKEDDVRGIDL